jgi:hypothetical protein
MSKHYLHTFRVQFTTPRRLSDSMGELVGYDTKDPSRHDDTYRVVTPEVGYKPAVDFAQAYVWDHYNISAYSNLEVTAVGDPVEIDALIRVS